MIIKYKLDGKIYTGEVIYFEKDGIARYDSNNEIVHSNHYQVKHGNHGIIDLFGDEVISVSLSNKIIFLDIDGVLNFEIFYHAVKDEKHLKNNIDPSAAGLIVKLCEETGAKIAISSSWRFDELSNLIKRLRIAGIKDKYIAGICSTEHPNEFREGVRGDVIQRYIDENNVTNYVILDDDDDMLDHQKPHLIKINRVIGFTKRDLERSIKILNKL